MDFKQLQSFETVVRLESFTRAAEALYLSQPTISAHIRALEEELGCQLILRTTKSLEITPQGREAYGYACNILSLRERLAEVGKKEERRIIHIGASTIPSAYLLPELLSAYGRACPDVYFIVHQGDSQSVIDSLRDGVFDVGLVGMETPDPELSFFPVCEDRMVLITPVNDHFLELARAKTPALSLLLTEPVILRESGSGSRKSAGRFLARSGISESDLQVTARINDQEAIKNLVASGMGISMISERAARNFLDEKRLLAFELPEDAGLRSLYLAAPRHRAQKPYVTSFVEFVCRERRRYPTQAPSAPTR